MLYSSSWLVAFAVCANCATNFSDSQPYPSVDVGYAKYRGIANSTSGVNGFYGIRYAAAPVNDLRWQPPVRIENANDYDNATVVDATSRGPQCLQQSPGWASATISGLLSNPVTQPSSEDCLLLDVLVPSVPRSSALPVMVAIHGGGYVQGSTSSADGNHFLSAANGSIIYVQIQYRLGAFGFLAGSEISANGSANVGLLDQRFAIEWVQRHISAFGGDPDKVVIQGGSAGGGSVTGQLQLYGGTSKPPFRGAIADFPWWQTFHNSTLLELQYQSLLSTAHCSTLACLRALPYTKLAAVINETYVSDYTQRRYYGVGDYYYGPSVDGTIIRGPPTQEFAAGRFSRVPLLVNRDALEGPYFTNLSITTTQQLISNLQQLWPSSTTAFGTRLQELYDPDGFDAFYKLIESNPILSVAIGPLVQIASGVHQIVNTLSGDGSFAQAASVFGDAFVNCGTRTLSAVFTRFSIPVWKSIYNSGILLHGAFELAYLTEIPIASAQPQQAIIQNYILSFVRELDPNKVTTIPLIESATQIKLHWPTYGSQHQTLQFNYTGNYVAHDPDDGPRCDFFSSEGLTVGN